MTPYIISASRREDIPAHKGKWFIDKLKEGKVVMSSSFTDYEISFEKLKLIVFWTKNPKPFIKYLDEIHYKYYFQFTLNDYPEYELNIPSLEERIETFKELSDKIGKRCLIWRHDPIIVNQKLRSDEILSRIENIGNQLYNYTEKLVFSFVDPYKKLKDQFNEIDNDTQVKIVKKLIEFNKKWNLKLGTCAEGLNLEGIEHNKCVDPELVTRICGKQKWITNTKDKTQRELCGCVPSGDIGSFKSCEHKCVYCYAK